jgi:hypothetical protein
LTVERGWLVLEPVYRENDTSASTRSRTRRPVFEEMLHDLSGGCAGVRRHVEVKLALVLVAAGLLLLGRLALDALARYVDQV